MPDTDPLPPLARMLTGPPGAPLLGAAGVTALIVLNYASVPGGGNILVLLAALTAGSWVAIGWLARFAVGLARADGRGGIRGHWVRWAAAPVIGLIVAGLTWSDLAFQARFAASRPGLESYARSVEAGSEFDGWAGLYPVSSPERLGTHGVRFLVDGSGFIDRYGFAYLPGGAVEESGDYTHLDGPWYVWRWNW
ncbi:hypothetical protein OIE66_21670 [Nonomuraea sp. NBC_01738]|uniref:hypothetical protein n=1 Tax=Nonomuraea sp. NBC_01738 TaxID=2976003 RepID=UPI002E0DBA77|nr:hypothetical protein OIE66_21670 [Nonomuraea sp. NBC_01738]